MRAPRRRRLPEPVAVALRALNRREHSIAEIEAKLAERDFRSEQIEEAVAELVASGALDDRRFALAFSADKRELGGWGPERIAGALAERGIPAALIEECCAGESREELVERAQGLLAERGETLQDDGSRARALGFLTRRGYDYELAYDAIRAAARPA